MVEEISRNFQDESFSDVVIVTSDKEWKLHKVILSSRSGYFKTLFSKQSNSMISRLEFHEIESDVFGEIVKYIYTGHFTTKDKKKLLQNACYFQIPSLERVLSIGLKSTITEQSAFELLEFSINFNCDTLKNECLIFFEKKGDVLLAPFMKEKLGNFSNCVVMYQTNKNQK